MIFRGIDFFEELIFREIHFRRFFFQICFGRKAEYFLRKRRPLLSTSRSNWGNSGWRKHFYGFELVHFRQPELGAGFPCRVYQLPVGTNRLHLYITPFHAVGKCQGDFKTQTFPEKKHWAESGYKICITRLVLHVWKHFLMLVL